MMPSSDLASAARNRMRSATAAVRGRRAPGQTAAISGSAGDLAVQRCEQMTGPPRRPEVVRDAGARTNCSTDVPSRAAQQSFPQPLGMQLEDRDVPLLALRAEMIVEHRWTTPARAAISCILPRRVVQVLGEHLHRPPSRRSDASLSGEVSRLLAIPEYNWVSSVTLPNR